MYFIFFTKKEENHLQHNKKRNTTQDGTYMFHFLDNRTHQRLSSEYGQLHFVHIT